MKLPNDHPTLGSKKTSWMPHAKEPKARPPRGWRENVVFPLRSLPTYTGPYAVATMEIEVPAQNPRHFSDIKRDGRHMLQLKTVLMTIYYPTDHVPPKSTKGHTRPSRQLWLGRPRMGLADAYGRFGGIGKLGYAIFLPTMFTKLPAYRNAPISSDGVPRNNANTSSTKEKTQADHIPEGTPSDPSFPLVLFSHGLGGTRTMYSSVCGEFASYGFVVCAVEHRDGSGPRTYTNHTRNERESRSAREKHGDADRTADENKKGFDVTDYLFPKGNPMDTSPTNEKGVDKVLRDAQIALRMAEIEEAYWVVCEIANGNGQQVADRNLRRKGFKASSSHGLDGLDWPRWKDRVCLDNATACGHSFGAATTVEILRQSDRFHYISQGIIYDIWGAIIHPPEEKEADKRIKCPVLAINSEAFTYWPSNFELVESLIEGAKEKNPVSSPAWLMTLRGTVHISQSDFSLLYPGLSSFFLKAVADPQRALDLNINASLDFLSKVLPTELAAQVDSTFDNENLLDSEITQLDRIPTSQNHRPDDENIAMFLKIRHEWLVRISPKLAPQNPPQARCAARQTARDG